MISLLVGLVTVAVGLWGVAHWFDRLIFVLKGTLPLMMVMGGMVAILSGISALRRPPHSGGDQ